MNQTRLKILFCPMDAIGHINACLGIADLMAERGHEIQFVVAKDWKENIVRENYPVEIYKEIDLDGEEKDERNDLESWSQLWKVDTNPNTSLVDRDGKVLRVVFKKLTTQVKRRHNFLAKLITSFVPDLIVIDTLVSMPAVESSGIPWIGIWSANPARIFSGYCPPADSGLPTTSDRKSWDQFQAQLDCYLSDIRDEYAKWIQSKKVELKSIDFLNDSPYLNLYSYPQEIDYTDIAPVPDKWFRLDGLIRKTNSTPMPDEFLRREGFKKIYFSLGSLGSGNRELMVKLIAILSKVPYLVLLSLGPYSSEYSLTDRMYGEKFVNQLQILPHVDLVITHGGNNTVIESLHAGKPMIILPIFGDQPDNAQRLQEKGLGIRLDTFAFTEEQLIEAIEKLIHDENLTKRLTKIADTLKNSSRGKELVKILERISLDNHEAKKESPS